jgi:hypothetical protein
VKKQNIIFSSIVGYYERECKEGAGFHRGHADKRACKNKFGVPMLFSALICRCPNTGTPHGAVVVKLIVDVLSR